VHRLLTTSALALCGALATAAPAVGATAPASPPPQTMRDLVGALDGSAANPTDPRYDDLRKLDGRIQAASAYRLTHGPGRIAPAATTGGATTTSAGVLVDVYVHGDVDAAADELRDHGMTVTATSAQAPQRMVEGYLPPAQAPAVAGLDTTAAVASVLPPRTRQATTHTGPGSVLSAGDALLHGPAARTLAGANGAGVKVGIMSDSMNAVSPGVAGSQSTNDLPVNVRVLAEGHALSAQDPLIDEGRAMGELIYDGAPGITDLDFATGYVNGSAARAANIAKLVDDHMRVIADDIGDTSEPFFQDGIVSQAVDAAHAAGVAYFSAAGNEGRDAWQGTFSGGAGTGALENFGSGTTQTVAAVYGGGTLDYSLQWKQPWNQATTDFNLRYCVTGSGGGCSPWFGNPAGIPWIGFQYTNPDADTGDPTRVVSVQIKRASASGNPLMKSIVAGDIQNDYSDPTDSPSVDVDAAGAAGALAVGAVRASDASAHPSAPPAEFFSSRGPLTRYFTAAGIPLASPEVRQKPELAGIDGVNTSVADFAPFYGTSAATPSVAAAAAVLLSARPNMTADQLYAILEDPSNGVPVTCALTGLVVADTDCGSHLLDESLAMQDVLSTYPPPPDTTAPTVGSVTTPATPDGRNGWFRRSVTVGWTYTDPETAVHPAADCEPVTVTSDGTTSHHCDATSAGGTAHGSVTVKRDATPPATPSVHGLGSGTYQYGAVPTAAAVTCTSSDATSGVDSCRVTGVSTATGTHTATATATDRAGNTSTKVVTYTVVKPAAIKTLRAKRVGRSALLRRGLRFTVVGRKASTKLAAKLTVKVRGHRYTVGTTTTTIKSGAHAVRIRLSAGGRRRVRPLHRPTLTLAVSGRATNAKTTTLTRSVHVGS
jgi:subtilisin family serine protease